MTKRNLEDVARDMADLDATIGIIKNYISLLQLQASNADSKDRILLFWSLTEEKGLDNILDNLDIMSKQLGNLTNEVGKHARLNELAQNNA